jgi:hypothetical protein
MHLYQVYQFWIKHIDLSLILAGLNNARFRILKRTRFCIRWDNKVMNRVGLDSTIYGMRGRQVFVFYTSSFYNLLSVTFYVTLQLELWPKFYILSTFCFTMYQTYSILKVYFVWHTQIWCTDQLPTYKCRSKMLKITSFLYERSQVRFYV